MVDNNETIKTEGLKEFTKGLQSSLFATRETVEEAFGEVFVAIKGNPAGVTAVQILLNTIASHIERNYIEKGEDNE
jgi:hypothetical protein